MDSLDIFPYKTKQADKVDWPEFPFDVLVEGGKRGEGINDFSSNSVEKPLRTFLDNPIDSLKQYFQSKSGFWYYYNNKVDIDSLKTPGFGDIVNYNYNVKALNGNLIYSKEALKTQNYAMDKQELFTGLREGLKLMKTGETVTFIFPSQKAYGYYGDENKIGRNTPLICEVTVNSITQN